jgi:hypothetical protein
MHYHVDMLQVARDDDDEFDYGDEYQRPQLRGDPRAQNQNTSGKVRILVLVSVTAVRASNCLRANTVLHLV